MSKDSPRLSRLGVLAPAALSACMDASVLAVPAAGAIVSTVLKELSKAFMLKKWYHGGISAKEAEHLMMDKGRNGSFLVRESQTHPGEYVLSVRVRGRVSHVMIRKQNNKYDVGSGEQFDDLVGLIEHFRTYPIIETSGDVLRLLQPVGGISLRAHVQNSVKEMRDFSDNHNDPGLDGEFHSLNMLDNVHVFTTVEGSKPENASKNRYRNVLPYDQTRVVLRRDEDSGETDYINANYIHTTYPLDPGKVTKSRSISDNLSVISISRGDTKKAAPSVTKSLSDDALRDVKNYFKMDKSNISFSRNIIKDKIYIATQGCLPNTINDFWLMLWQEDVRVVAMITNEVERGKKKCERYWPPSGEEGTYGELTVKWLSETKVDEYIVREFDVNDTANCRTMYLYQYTGWPDHSIPPDSNHILMFLEDINRRMYRISQEKDSPEENVLCVHCSAGVGRTGTFIVLDMLIDKIKMSKFQSEYEVHDTVKLVRSQRSGLVQTKAQYRFIYLSLQYYLDNNNIKIRKDILLKLKWKIPVNQSMYYILNNVITK
ncbi:tyrosine-protein phosphatase corkscrew-like isoform X2 [Nymphalis io]|uniref:tyrosine-protein phosphatase corkscrew-like isoform X2 n=1 Tax=Inachis io TaxID=171585 RepID=UPI0021670BC8|nr:tyrosine-protein phosphatase corkscrew-like isoform X2 [Nymphalis io]